MLSAMAPHPAYVLSLYPGLFTMGKTWLVRGMPKLKCEGLCGVGV